MPTPVLWATTHIEMYKAWSFLKRDLITDASYKMSFAIGGANVLVTIAAYYFLARVIRDGAQDGYAAFPFLLVGMAVNGFMMTALACFASAVRGAQAAATLKLILSTPTSPLGFVLLSSTYPLVRSTIDLFLYLAGGALFGLTLSRGSVPGLLALFLMAFVAFASIGILSAAFTLIFKRGEPLLWLFGSLCWVMGGVLFPVAELPEALQRMASLLPLTPTLHGVRASLLGGATVRELMPEIAALASFCTIALPVSLAAFTLSVRHAKVAGTIGHV